MTSDFSTNYCSSCDIAIYNDSLYCSTKCRKKEAKRQLQPSVSSTSLSERTKSSSIYALSNPSTSSVISDQNVKRTSTDANESPNVRPALERRGSSQMRPLPVKRSSYSSSAPRSVDLVTPTMTPMTGTYTRRQRLTVAVKPNPSPSTFTFPILPAGGRFNHNATEEPECRRMFYFKEVQKEYEERDK